jgi:hypothetical protein
MVVTYFIERSLSKRIRLLQQSNFDCTCLYDQRQADVCLESAVLLQLVQIFAAPEIRQPKMGFFQLLIACLVLALAPTWSFVISKSNNLFLNTITYVIESFSILRIWRTTGSTGTEHHHGCLRAIHTVRKKNSQPAVFDQSPLILHFNFRFNPTRPQILEHDNLELLQKSYFDPLLPTKIFAHGWNGSPMSAYSTRDGKSFFKRSESEIKLNLIKCI